jgi:hypothetical protein
VRVASGSDVGSTAYVRTNRFEIGAPLTFDAKYPAVTALEYLLAAVAGDVIACLRERCRKHRVPLGRVEALIHGSLNNPLVFLGVVGEQGDPALNALVVRLFVETRAEETLLREAWEEALARSPMVNTFRALVRLAIELERT